MKNSSNKLKIHIKNNKWAKGSFPNSPEGEKVFTITKERFQEALVKFPEVLACFSNITIKIVMADGVMPEMRDA